MLKSIYLAIHCYLKREKGNINRVKCFDMIMRKEQNKTYDETHQYGNTFLSRR